MLAVTSSIEYLRVETRGAKLIVEGAWYSLDEGSYTLFFFSFGLFEVARARRYNVYGLSPKFTYSTRLSYEIRAFPVVVL